MWQWEAILQASFVQVGEVNAHLPLPVGLLHQDHIRESFWVVGFLDESRYQETVYLFSYHRILLVTEVSLFLFDFPGHWVDVEPVLNDGVVYPGHLIMDPSKQFLVFGEETFQSLS